MKILIKFRNKFGTVSVRKNLEKSSIISDLLLDRRAAEEFKKIAYKAREELDKNTISSYYLIGIEDVDLEK